MIMVKYNTNSKWRRIILSFITCLWTLFIFGQNSKTKKVLFVGNSYTYFWNLPLTVQVFAEKDSVVFETRQSTGGGMSLRQHWNQENNLKTMDIIQSAEWDCIILQDHSMQACLLYTSPLAYVLMNHWLKAYASVSYTHLDVYKRQPYECVGPGRKVLYVPKARLPR